VKAGIGGKIRGISLDSFLQVVQMDRMTCTIGVVSEWGSGTLYFVKGEIFSAVTGDKVNAEAACQIISWEDSDIELDESCDRMENEIVQPLMNILMEAMRLRDEAKAAKKEAPPEKTSAQEHPERGATLHKEKQVSGEAPISTGATGPSKRRLPILITAGIICLLGLLVAAYLVRERMARTEYEALLTQVEGATPLKKKSDLLSAYIARHPGGKLALEAEKRLARLDEKIGAQRLSDVESRCAPLLKKGDLEGALTLFEALEKAGLKGQPAAALHRKIDELRGIIDAQAYEKLMAATKGKGPERIDAYLRFLKSYPKSPHGKEVEGLLSKMSQEYYYYTENRILENEKAQNWDACLKLSQRYIDIYPYSENAVTLTRYQALCKEEKRDEAAFQDLLKQAAALGDDYSRMIQLYTDYLKAHPQSHARDALEKEITKDKALAEQKRRQTIADQMKTRLSQVSKRFTLHGDGTVSDVKTGLMWCLLDSTTELSRCLDFGDAKQYVTDLKTGGHTDWRLPTKEELTGLYYQQPAFPSNGPTWYWTSQIHKKYLGRWMIDVDVVTTETKPEKEVKNKASWHCGAVRAVRGGR
jgi:Protein of unknown function (DUF1566)/Domain of unknown function (DUF4388)